MERKAKAQGLLVQLIKEKSMKHNKSITASLNNIPHMKSLHFGKHVTQNGVYVA
jgi:hypothetical protein